MRTLTTSRGLTLVEVIVAFALLLFGTLAVISMQRTAEGGNDDAMALQRATTMAQELLEAARGVDYDDPRLDGTSGFETPPSSLLDTSGAPSQAQPLITGFSRTWRVEADQPIADTKTIRARVTWTMRGVDREVMVSTVRAE